MDLFSSIFDDKRPPKKRTQGKSNTKNLSKTVKTKKPITPIATDKKPKTILKHSISQDEKHVDNKNIRKTNNDLTRKENSGHSLKKEQLKEKDKKIEIKAVNKNEEKIISSVSQNEKHIHNDSIQQENNNTTLPSLKKEQLKGKEAKYQEIKPVIENINKIVSSVSQIEIHNHSDSIKKEKNNTTLLNKEQLIEKDIKNQEIKNEENKIDPSLIRSTSKHFQDNSPFEDSFESAVEVYDEGVIDEKDADFGRQSFTSLDQDYFVEAYNKEGSELLQTWIQLSFTEFDDSGNKSFENAQKSTCNHSKPTTFDELIFVSDDEEEIFCETFNSKDYVLRKKDKCNKLENKLQDNTKQELVCSSNTNTINKPIRTDSLIKRELRNRNSFEEPHFEEKSVQELIMETNPTFLHDISVRRSSSSYSHNGLSRNNSNSSRGSYALNLYTKTDESDDEDDNNDFPKLQLSFEVRTKADMIIQELLETEYTYIENLTIIKKDYMLYFRKISKHASGMFGNIAKILKETKNFYRSLHLCGNNCEYIAKTIEDYRYLFKLYPDYSKNKLKADILVQKRFKPILLERQKALGHKLDLASYLLNPVQRLGRYILLLKSLQKNIRKSECLDGAINVLESAMKRGNDYVAIESILDCDIDLTTKGSYIDREKFLLLKPRREEIVLFLFEKVVVFTLEKPNTERFIYKSSINLDDLQIIHSEGDDQVFQLRNYTQSKKNNQEPCSYTLEGRNVKLTETWVQLIQDKLWEQLQQVKALSKTYKIPENKKVMTSSSVKLCQNQNVVQRRGRTSSDRNAVKSNTKFYVEDTNGYETL